jgi:shikimate kinase
MIVPRFPVSGHRLLANWKLATMALASETRKIFLIGLPGSGKTTLAKQVADKIQLSFLDLDKEIEKRASEKVEEIFSVKGEPHFRKVERETLVHFCDSGSGFIMATGGGAPCFSDNLELMKKAGLVIFLDVPTKIISDRISKQSVNRPLLKHETPDSLKDRIEFLRSQRISFYRNAHHTLSGSQIQPTEIIDLLG